MPELATADLGRIESFGDNCELGFVLRRLGCEDGMLFRWTSISPESLLATLRSDFADLYVFENLVAHRNKMVLDRLYGTSWHTAMASHTLNGTQTFLLGDDERRAIHFAEQLKRSHLVAKLKQKFRHSNPVFVIKCNETVSPQLVEELHYQLYRRVDSHNFVLLEVRADPGLAGQTETVARTLLRGYVSSFASYQDAENGDDPSWHRILARALAHHAGGQLAPASASARSLADIILPFPLEHEPCLKQVVTGDVRAGLVRLLRGDRWCRLVDDDMYRLHAHEIGEGATVLRWTGAHLPSCFTINLYAECAIADSKPVRATLTVQDGSGNSLDRSRTLWPGKPEQLTVESDWHQPGAVTIEFKIEPLQQITEGQRAVIDIQPIVCRAA